MEADEEIGIVYRMTLAEGKIFNKIWYLITVL